MDKEDIDRLYHLLRKVSNTTERNSPLPNMIYGLSRHLLAGGDYLSLIQFLSYYGETFLVEPVTKALKESGWKFDRVVELGAGLGWLGRRIAINYDNCPALFVDKRPWTMIDLVADIETPEGMTQVLNTLKQDDLIVMSEFVHCLNNPIEVLEQFSRWPKLIIEYQSENLEHHESYTRQIQRYGAGQIQLWGLAHLADHPGDMKIIQSSSHVIIFIPPRSQ